MGWVGHKKRWESCTRCELCETRNKVVLGKGKLPCDVLFIGEAPGLSENVIGQPFTGPAGKLLDKIIAQSLPDNTRIAWTNLIACIPLDVDGTKVHEPHKDHINECSPRLRRFVKMADPQMIVQVGSLSTKWVPKLVEFDGVTVSIIHPAAILRADITQRGLAVQQSIVRIRDSWEDAVPF